MARQYARHENQMMRFRHSPAAPPATARVGHLASIGNPTTALQEGIHATCLAIIVPRARAIYRAESAGDYHAESAGVRAAAGFQTEARIKKAACLAGRRLFETR